MKIIEAGHRYRLEGYDGSDPQMIQFMKREGDNFPFNFGQHGGTNCQEVLRALIDRSEYLQKQKPCAETEAIIASLKTCLFLFESRAARMHQKTLSCTDLGECVRAITCKECGHVNCSHHT